MNITPRKLDVLGWLKVVGAWLGWLLALLQFLFSNPPPPVQ